MSFPLLIASIVVGVLVTCVGIYRAYNQGEFMPMILGMLILMSCGANYLKRKRREGKEEDNQSSSQGK
jgi:F0F1-type ATP synthase assembly protein I